MRWPPVGVRYMLVVVAIAACACPKKHGEPAGTGQGSGAGSSAAVADACTAVKSHVEQLYRVEAQHAEPKRVDEAVADNTRMVMHDCAQDPSVVSACVGAAKTAKDLEANCLARVDEAGNPVKR
jgi:hypothetical protein